MVNHENLSPLFSMVDPIPVSAYIYERWEVMGKATLESLEMLQDAVTVINSMDKKDLPITKEESTGGETMIEQVIDKQVAILKKAFHYSDEEYRAKDIEKYLTKLVQKIVDLDPWVSVEERLPEKDGAYLVYVTTPEGDHLDMDHWESFRWGFYHSVPITSESTYITHWLKITPPKGA